MNYELAKELEAAGFQKRGGPMFIEDDFFPPHLEELIEACGDQFGRLEKIGQSWVAIGGWNTATAQWMLVQHSGDLTTAVARLWLALNKK